MHHSDYDINTYDGKKTPQHFFCVITVNELCSMIEIGVPAGYIALPDQIIGVFNQLTVQFLCFLDFFFSNLYSSHYI
jgi:hypothetical protein